MFAVVLWGCSESSTTSKGSSQDQFNNCYTNPSLPGCSGTTGGVLNCTPAQYGSIGSQCFCSVNQSHSSCTNTGTSTGTSSGGSTTGGSYGTITDDNWRALYDDPTNMYDRQSNGVLKPSVPPISNCPTPSGSGYETRKGTITMAFQKDPVGQTPRDDYSPLLPLSGFSNISPFFKNVSQSAGFLDSDGRLRIRVMPRPQPQATAGTSSCYGRTTVANREYGYTKLSYTLSIKPVLANGTLGDAIDSRIMTTDINTCSPVFDFTGINQSSQNGVVLVLENVTANSGCFNAPCSTWDQVTSMCWQMDVEVATEATKNF